MPGFDPRTGSQKKQAGLYTSVFHVLAWRFQGFLEGKKKAKLPEWLTFEQTSPVLGRKKIGRGDISLSTGKPKADDFVLFTGKSVLGGTFLGQVVSGQIVLTHKKKTVREPGQRDKYVYVKRTKPKTVRMSGFNPMVDRIMEFERVD